MVGSDYDNWLVVMMMIDWLVGCDGWLVGSDDDDDD